MEQTLIVSNILLWLLVIGLGGAVILLARQVGVLHERITPVGALMVAKSVRVGEAAPLLRLASLTGGEVTIGGTRADGASTLAFFLSPTCPVCATLLPTARALARQTPGLRLVLASDGEAAEHQAFIARKGLDDLPYVLSEQLGLGFGVSKLPYAVLIDGEGIVRAHGLVNTREHLESLIEAEREGVASIQDYMKRERAAAEAARGGE